MNHTPPLPPRSPLALSLPPGPSSLSSLALGLLILLIPSLVPAAAQTPSPFHPEEIYQRATNDFAAANFFKPIEPPNADLAFKLAPLVIQELAATNSPSPLLDRFGTLTASNGAVTLDHSQPALYVASDSVDYGGISHARFTYLWFYSAAQPLPAPGRLPVQGVRLTLNAAGAPVIWEVLADRSGAQLMVVAQSLENAARAEFGQPLPGRRYAIERSLADAPRTVVARVIDDGPVAMGPIVYLNARTRFVSTLICRCMPAQAKMLLATSSYELLPLSSAPVELLVARVKSRLRNPVRFWPGESRADDRLDQHLRLPGKF